MIGEEREENETDLNPRFNESLSVTTSFWAFPFLIFFYI